jgi:hypothetical protein
MFSDLSGKLHIAAIWPAEHTEITISYSSPQYARLLCQIPPEIAVKRLGQIVTLCPYSQRWVAAGALNLPFEFSSVTLSQEWLSADVWFLFQMAQHTSFDTDCLGIIPAIKQNKESAWLTALGQPLESWLDVVESGEFLSWLMTSNGLFAHLLRHFYQPSWEKLWPSEKESTPFLILPNNNQILQRMTFRLWRLVNLALGRWTFTAPTYVEGDWVGDVPRGKVSHRIALDPQTGLIQAFDILTPTDRLWQSDNFDFLSTNLNQKASREEWMSWIQALDPGVPLEWNN